IEHGLFHQVCCTALNRCIDGSPAGKTTPMKIAAPYIRYISPSLKDGCDKTLSLCFFDYLIHVSFYTGETLEIFLYIGLCFTAGNSQVSSQAKGTHPISNTKINHLGMPPHIWCNF